MSENGLQTNKDAQKTVIAFIAGLLIGGLLVWVFAEPSHSDEEVHDHDDDAAEVADSDNDSQLEDSDEQQGATDEVPASLPQGDGSLNVNNQSAGNTVALEGAVFPSDEGWIGVRDYENGQLGSVLGVARYSKDEGLVPSSIALLRATEAGKEYAVVFYSENGDHTFNLATDVQVEGVFETFTAE